MKDPEDKDADLNVFDDFLGFVALQDLEVESFEQEFLQGAEVAEPAAPDFAEEVGAWNKQEEPEQAFPFDLDAEEYQDAVLPAGDHAGAGAAVEAEVDQAGKQEEAAVFAEGGVLDEEADEGDEQEDGDGFVDVGVFEIGLPGFGRGGDGGFGGGKFIGRCFGRSELVRWCRLSGGFGSGLYLLEFLRRRQKRFAIGRILGHLNHRAVGRHGVFDDEFGVEVGGGDGQTKDASYK